MSNLQLKRGPQFSGALPPKSLLGLLLIFLLFSNCKNDDDLPCFVPDLPQSAYAIGTFTLLTPGNYWVYQETTLNELGEILSIGNLDSNYIEKDTMINGSTYAKFIYQRHNQTHVQLLRDSMEYLIDETGRRILSTDNFGELLSTSANEAIVSNEYMVGYRDVTTPLGTFNALKKEIDIIYIMEELDQDCSRFPNEYWMRDIGLIRGEDFYSSNCNRLRYDLVRWSVN